MSDKPSTNRVWADMPNLSALLTYPSSNTREPGRYASIRIEDETSGQVIAEIELNPDQFYRLMSNGTAYGNGRVNLASERFGRIREREEWPLERAEWGLPYGNAESHAAVQAYMKTARDDGWEIVRYQNKHGKHSIECIRWVEPKSDSQPT